MSAAERGPGGPGAAPGGPGAAPGGPGAGPEPGGGRKARGRPRLTDTDRARRRLESRKKYDVRRVYLGEAHGPWVELRRRSGWSDAKLAAYLLGLERGQRAGRRGKPWEQLPKKPKRKKRRRRNVNCLRHAVLWYEDHGQRCPYEPRLAELEPALGLLTTAVWQCERGHRYFQDLHPPLRPESGSEGEDAPGSSSSSSSSSSCSSSGSEAAPAPGGGPAVPPPPPPGGPEPPPEALEAVLCLPLPILRGGPGPPPTTLLLLGGLGLGGVLGGLQEGGLGLEGLQQGPGGLQVLLQGGGGSALATPPTPEETQLPQGKTEEDEEEEEEPLLRLKQEEPPPPPPPPEPPRDPSPAEEPEGSAIIYEIPTEPERPRRPRRSRRGRAPSPEPPEDPPEEPPGPLSCPHPTCGQVFGTLGSVQSPLRQGQRRPRAQVCPQPGCGRSSHLAQHLRRHAAESHAGVREFTCATCAKSFKRRNHLEVHRRTHTGERPLQCEVCGFRCRQRASLTWHMRRHGGLQGHPEPRGT
ncbi:zinc finger protein 653 [Zonotrichia leucophrys gambelii]|uniref:zinc finger protein 653 n=1 Tax=Zonotrichia leucophrys gambelii TaxID=257770 RepID=UPI0031404EF3